MSMAMKPVKWILGIWVVVYFIFIVTYMTLDITQMGALKSSTVRFWIALSTVIAYFIAYLVYALQVVDVLVLQEGGSSIKQSVIDSINRQAGGHNRWVRVEKVSNSKYVIKVYNDD